MRIIFKNFKHTLKNLKFLEVPKMFRQSEIKRKQKKEKAIWKFQHQQEKEDKMKKRQEY